MEASTLFARAWSWEDAALLGALAAGPDDDVAVFEASGDDALTIGAMGVRTVHAYAPDAGAHALVALKRAAARELPAQSVRSLLGLGHFGRRVWFYHYLRPGLPPDVQAWWDPREAAIREGIAEAGVVEHAMTDLRVRVLPWVVGRAAVGALLAAPTLDAQQAVLHGRWRGLRWRAAGRVALPRLARLAGADETDALARFDAVLSRVPLAQSPYARWLLSGAWPEPDGAPVWSTPAGLAALKPRIATIATSVSARAEALAAAVPGAWSIVLLGRAPLTPAEATGLTRGLRPGGRALGWGPPPTGLRIDPAESVALAAMDRSVFPGRPWIGRMAGA